MYRGYTQNFRIFGAMIIFLQISKDLALFKIRKYKISLFFSFLLTDSLIPPVSDSYSSWRRCPHWPALKCVDGDAPVRETSPK